MVDNARDEEERPLIERVGQDADDNGQNCGFSSEGQQRGENAKLADRRVGKQRFHVPEPDGYDRADEHCDAAKNEERPQPEGMVAEGGMQAGQQVDSRLDHRGRVQIGAGRGGGRHGAGQPPVKGELGRLGECAQQDQDQDHGKERQFSQSRASDNFADHVAATLLPQENQPCQQREPSARGNDKGVAGAAAGGRRIVLVADQQVARNAGALPENEEGQQIVGPDQPQHGGHE